MEGFLVGFGVGAFVVFVVGFGVGAFVVGALVVGFVVGTFVVGAAVVGFVGAFVGVAVIGASTLGAFVKGTAGGDALGLAVGPVVGVSALGPAVGAAAVGLSVLGAAEGAGAVRSEHVAAKPDQFRVDPCVQVRDRCPLSTEFALQAKVHTWFGVKSVHVFKTAFAGLAIEGQVAVHTRAVPPQVCPDVHVRVESPAVLTVPLAQLNVHIPPTATFIQALLALPAGGLSVGQGGAPATHTPAPSQIPPAQAAPLAFGK